MFVDFARIRNESYPHHRSSDAMKKTAEKKFPTQEENAPQRESNGEMR